MSNISPRLYADLVGRPFVPGGRGPHEFDCVGLTLEFQRRRGRTLPPYLSDEASLHRAVASGGPLHEAHRISAPEPGCLVLMVSDIEPGRHIGSMVDQHRMLHTYQTIGSAVIVVLNRSLWRPRVLGFYRPEARA